MTAPQRLLSGLHELGHALMKRAQHAALDVASYSIAAICNANPRLDDRRQIHHLRMRLTDAHFRIADLEDQVANYKAMHELQHGKTVDLPLTVEPLHVKPHRIN